MTDREDAKTLRRAASVTPDGAERIRDFFARHGGPGADSDTATGEPGQTLLHVRAADGYELRCQWSHVGSRSTMSFTEIPPAAAADPP